MRSRLKAKIEMKLAFLCSLQNERESYVSLRDKSLTHDVNYSYYQSKIRKCDPLIVRAKAEIEALERELEICPLKEVFRKPLKMAGIEYRDNSQ